MSSTTDDLVEDVRELAFLPDAGPTTSAVILRHADACMVGSLSALIKTARMEHWVTPDDVAGDGSTVRFRIPRRALDRAYRMVTIADSTGRESPCFEVEPGSTWRDGRRYYVEMDTLVFTAAPSVGYTVRVRNRRRSSKLVPVSECAAITNAPSTTSLTLATCPAAMVSETSRYFDVVRGDSPFDLLYTDLLAHSLAVGVVTLSGTTPVVVADFVDLTVVGNARQDYLCLRDQTCYPPIPEALFPALVAGTAFSVLESLGDPRLPAVAATFKARSADALSLVSPRDDEGGVPIINRNSSLRSGSGGWRRGVRW